MTRWTQEDLDRIKAQRDIRARHQTALTEKRSKYGNTRVVVDGIKFDSKREAAIWNELTLRQKAGEIHDLQRQVPFPLHCPVRFESINGFAEVATFVADFVWVDHDGTRHVADCKGGTGTITKEFRLKARWLALQSGITIEIL